MLHTFLFSYSFYKNRIHPAAPDLRSVDKKTAVVGKTTAEQTLN